MKKPEEQARVVSQTAEFPDSTSITMGFPTRQVEVNECKDDRKIAKCVWPKKGAKVITIIVKCHSRWTEMLRRTRWISCSLVQKEHSWMNREVRTTVLMVICKDDGNLSATRSVRTKTDEYGVEMVLRFLSLDQNDVTLCLTGHYQEGDELAREQFRRFGRKLARRPSVFSKCVDAQH